MKGDMNQCHQIIESTEGNNKDRNTKLFIGLNAESLVAILTCSQYLE